MKGKGFTLLETILSVTIFSVLMAIVFGAWSEFQKLSFKNEGKQDTNITFVNVYKNIDKYVTSSTVRLFQCYCEKNSYNSDVFAGAYKNRRWFAFLLSRDNYKLDGNLTYNPIINVENEILDSTDSKKETPHKYNPQRLIYNTCVVYLLNYEPNHCDGFNYCPHKSLYRYVFKTDYDCYFGYDYDINYDAPTITDDKSIENYRFTATQKFKHELDTKVQQILEAPLNNTIAQPSIIESNIIDLKINKNDEQIQFYLTLLRISDAERHFKFDNNHQLTNLDSAININYDDEVKKYIETLSWISIPRNTINNL